jgi:hypothetical protein
MCFSRKIYKFTQAAAQRLAGRTVRQVIPAHPTAAYQPLKMHLFWFIMQSCFLNYLLRFMPKKAQTHHRSQCGIGLKA